MDARQGLRWSNQTKGFRIDFKDRESVFPPEPVKPKKNPLEPSVSRHLDPFLGGGTKDLGPTRFYLFSV